MKIAFIALRGVPLSDGIVRVTDVVASELSKLGHDVTVYTSDRYGNINGNYNGYKIITVHAPKIGFLEKMVLTKRSAKLAVKEDFDIYHFEAMGPSYYAKIPFKKGKKVVIQSHGIEYDRPKWNWFAKFVLKTLEKKSLKYCQCLTVVSKKIKRHFLTKYNYPSLYIPNFTRNPQNGDIHLLEKYGIEANKYFLFLNRIDAGKGVHYLVNAYNEIDTTFKLVICGELVDGNEYHELIKNLAKNNPNILLMGNVDGELKNTLYENAYVCLQTSESEGMSTSLLEAMSYGRCSIVSDIEENIDVAEDSAISFKSTDVGDLKRCLLLAASSPDIVSNKGKSAFNIWKNNFTIEKVVNMYLEMYNQIVYETSKQN